MDDSILEVQRSATPEGCFVRLIGELDLASATDLERIIEDVDGGDVTVDMARLSFIDAAGLRVFATLHSRLSSDGRRVLFVDPPPNVRRVFTVANMGELIDIGD